MNVNIKCIGFTSSESVKAYIEKKLRSLSKLLKSLDEHDEGKFECELIRTTKHHHKGEVYEAKMFFINPEKNFTSSDEAYDMHIAIDAAKDKLKFQIEKYKELKLARIKK